MTLPTVDRFIESFKNGKILPDSKDDYIVASEGSVQFLTDKHYETVIRDPKKDVWVYFFASYQKESLKLMKIWNDIAEELSYIEDLVFAIMDSPETPEIASRLAKFPTLVFYP